MSVTSIKPPNSGYLGDTPARPAHEVMVINDRAYRIYTITVHEFRLGDVDDVEIYAAQPLWEWQQSEAGKWVMDHAIEPPEWHRHTDYVSFGHRFIIRAKLKDKDYTFWTLKWGSHN